MDTAGWKYLYKIDYANRHQVTTNMLYTPMINSDNTILCMEWNEAHIYQHENKNLTKELVDFFFEREVKYLKIMQQFDWAPRILEIDTANRRIFIEGSGETLNHIICGNRSLDSECPTWKEQLYTILADIMSAGYYKVALYPHCFFIDKNGKIKTIDFYSVIEQENPFIERKLIEGLIGRDSTNRFDQSTSDGVIDFKKFFEVTMLTHLGKTWFDNTLFPEFYKRLTND